MWGVEWNKQKFRNEESKLSGRESENRISQNTMINCYYAPIFGALYYGVYHKSGLPSIGTLLTADNQQPSVQTTCLVYVSEKLSTLTASYTFSSAGV